MTVFRAFMRDDHLDSRFRRCANARERLALAKSLREQAVAGLADAVARVPVVSDRVADMYAERGVRPSWNLRDNEHAVLFALALRLHAPTDSELRLAAVLRACVAAEEAGDVAPYADAVAGAAHREQQRARATGAKTPTATKRRAVVAYWRRVADGQKYGALKELSGQFGVSDKAIKSWLEEFPDLAPANSIRK